LPWSMWAMMEKLRISSCIRIWPEPPKRTPVG